MQFETFDQFFSFRELCLCGYVLSTHFKYSSADDSYTSVRPSGSYIVAHDKDLVIFPFEIESRLAPHGEVKFDLICRIHQNKVSIRTKSFTRTVISPLDFILKHFNKTSQQGVSIQMVRKCMNPQDCGYTYNLTCAPITFNLNSKTINPITLYTEHFIIRTDRHKYDFETDFTLNKTTISYDQPPFVFLTPKCDRVSMTADKYLNYKFDREFLLEKIKTLILFS